MNRTEAAVYAAVDRLAPNGYTVTIRHELERKTGRFVSFGTVWVTLDALEEAGWIRSQLEEGGPERGYRSKRVYYVARRPEQEESG